MEVMAVTALGMGKMREESDKTGREARSRATNAYPKNDTKATKDTLKVDVTVVAAPE